MNFEQLEYIVNVANEMSITKAAEKLFISSSAISQSISKLEKELDIVIFKRSRAGTILTEEGKVLVSRAMNILSNLQNLNEELDVLKRKEEKHLKIAAAPAFFDVFQESITNFKMENPNITIDIEELFGDKMLKNFDIDNYDIGFLAAEKDTLEKKGKFGFELLHKGIICIAVGKKSKLYDYDFVTPDDIDNEKLVRLKNSKNVLVNKISKNIKNQVIMTTSNPRLLLNMVKESNAFTFIHEFTINNFPLVESSDLNVIPIKYSHDSDYIYHDIWAIYPLSKGLSSSTEELIKHISLQLQKN